MNDIATLPAFLNGQQQVPYDFGPLPAYLFCDLIRSGLLIAGVGLICLELAKAIVRLRRGERKDAAKALALLVLGIALATDRLWLSDDVLSACIGISYLLAILAAVTFGSYKLFRITVTFLSRHRA